MVPGKSVSGKLMEEKKKKTLEEVAEKVDGEAFTCIHFSLHLPFLLSTDCSLLPARMQAQEEFYLAHQSIPQNLERRLPHKKCSTSVCRMNKQLSSASNSYF